MSHLGKLIIFEGTDGVGKSTQIQILADHLIEKGYDVVTTFEPTNGSYGQKIRTLYSDRGAVTKEEELQLFLDDRKEHVKTFLTPSLKQGKIVLCDRYYLSTAAYQGANGLNVEEILAQNSFAPEPDIALLLQMPVQEGRERITSLRGEKTNDFEKREMLEKVSTIFNSLNFPYIVKINAAQNVDAVHLDIVTKVTSLLQE